MSEVPLYTRVCIHNLLSQSTREPEYLVIVDMQSLSWFTWNRLIIVDMRVL